jgi:hypothetical protein
MLARIVRTCLIGTIGFLAVQSSRADGPGGIPALGPAAQAVNDAARISDPVAREAALRDAIRKGLLESSPAAANEVFGYLDDNIRWLDLRPYVDLLEEYHWLGRGRGLADHVELFCAPRDERLRIYAAAIVEGSTKLKRGTPLLRQTAMSAAAIDGLAELKPLIETYYPEESAEVRQGLPLQELLVQLDLAAGGTDREDARRLASERLAAMKDADFRDRMNTDAAFQRVVTEVAAYICAVDPYRMRRNPGCTSIKAIVKRQLQMEKTTEEAARATATTPAPPMQSYEEHRDSWLGRLQESSAGEPSARF